METILGDFIFRAKMIFLMRSMEQWRYAINSSAISPKKEINGNPTSLKLAVYATTNPILKKKKLLVCNSRKEYYSVAITNCWVSKFCY